MNFNDESSAPSKKPKVTKVRNKLPAPVQITAEQLLREAKERELEATPKPPQQKITTEEEKREYQLQKRQDYENNLRKDKLRIINWMKYASFEISQGEIIRARNVFERALNIHYKNVSVWLKYAEMEIEREQVNFARNLFQRALAILPRANQLWYKYVYMEEKLSNIEYARCVFKRWMRWSPEEQAWLSFIQMEKRYREFDNAREIYKQFVQVHPEEKNWIMWTKFEERVYRNVAQARLVFEAAVNFFDFDNPPPHILAEFAKFEERQHEHVRVKEVYKYALDNLPRSMSDAIYTAYHEYEKKYGDKMTIQESIVIKKRQQYETQLTADPLNYEDWFDYVKMLQDEEQPQEEVRNVFERAISNVPPVQKKYYWRRYIYLWIKYAHYEEIDCDNRQGARDVYTECLKHIPHKRFTFAKIWIFLAETYMRDNNITDFRKVLGRALGICPKYKLYHYYIGMERVMGEFDRVRTLYNKMVAFLPNFEKPWIEYAETEEQLGEPERARSIYEKALEIIEHDRPMFVWRKYIDFELRVQQPENCWLLYRRLLEHDSTNVLVWISFAEARQVAFNPDDGLESAEQVLTDTRSVYREGNDVLKLDKVDPRSRERLLKAWLRFEEAFGSPEEVAVVQKKMPRIKKQPKRVDNDDGTTSWQESTVLEFPEDLEAAQQQMVVEELLNEVIDW